MPTIDEKTHATAILISNILFRAALIGMALLLLACIPLFLLTDQAYAFHNSFVEMPREQYNSLVFQWLGNLKILVIVLFLVPAIAIRWSLRASGQPDV